MTMNDVMNNIIKRRSVRRFKDEQITDVELNTILKAGEYAPCSGSRQAPVFVACQNAQLNQEIGRINGEMMKAIMDKRPPMTPGSKQQPKVGNTQSVPNFSYGAPTVVTIFAPKNWHNFTLDAAVAAQNMCLAATSLGVGSCIIARATEVFATECGMEIQKEWGLSEDYEAKIHVLLGYPADELPEAAQRREGRVFVVK